MTTALTQQLVDLPVIEVLYSDLDNTLLGPEGSLLTGPDGRPSARAAVALVDAAVGGLTVVPVSGRAMPQLRNDARLLGLSDAIGEVGAVILRDGRTQYEWGECPGGIARNPHDTLTATGAVDAVLDAFPGELRPYEPWHRGREGGHLFHGVADVDAANDALAAAGCGWACLRDNGRTGGWEGRSVRAYHLLPRGVGKAPAVADDLAARGLRPEQAAAIGDSVEDLTMAPQVGAFFMVANGHDAPGTIRTPGGMGEGFADAVLALLAHRAGATRDNRQAPAPAEGTVVPSTVLVVEDDEMVADVIRISLTAEGYDVAHVTNTAAALSTIQASPPDLVLLDIMLPEVEGWEVLTQVRSQPHTAHIPVVIMTARTMPADEVRGYNLGASAFMRKPFTPDELLAQVDGVLQDTPRA
ncbi:MAG: response regulator [Nitriliruptorales bacterium]|nr:response regulator [Nitriliruptorales bacterium]